MATFHIDRAFDHDVLAQSPLVFNFAVPATPSQRVAAERVPISARMRRMSPMVAAGMEMLVPLQMPGAGIVLAPADASAPRGP